MPEMENAPSQAAEETVRDSVEKAFEDVEQHHVEDAVDDTAQPTDRADVSEPAEKQDASGRDKSGRFAKKEEEKPLTLEKMDPKASQELVEAGGTPLPASWGNAVKKEEWETLPASIRQRVLEREAEIHKGFTRMDEDRTFGKSLRDVINPYMPIIAAEGGDPIRAVKSLLNSAYVLRTASPQRRGELIMQLAREFGAEIPKNSSPDVYVDPTVQSLQQRLDTVESQRQQELAARQYHEQQTIQSEINAFAADPSHTHYETVRAEMAALFASGRATSLQDAYDKAVWSNPEIRSTLIAQQHADAEAKRLAENKTKIAAARNASASVRGGPGVSVPKSQGTPNRGVREEIEASYDAVVNRGGRI